MVKLTADAVAADGTCEPPSEMHVVGSPVNFEYGPKEGSAGCFHSRCFHQSIRPRGSSEHLKARCCLEPTPHSVGGSGPFLPHLVQMCVSSGPVSSAPHLQVAYFFRLCRPLPGSGGTRAPTLPHSLLALEVIAIRVVQSVSQCQ